MRPANSPDLRELTAPRHSPLGGTPTEIIAPDGTTVEPPSLFADPTWPRVRGYDLLSVLGAGGMGVIYKARHRDLQRTVALKTLRGAALTDNEFRERFHAEAEAVARLQHPNIIQVFEIGHVEPLPGQVHPMPFISLEFVDGGSLARKAEKPQTAAYSAGIVEKLARAVHAAHKTGVVHRDLKPANVLLTHDGDPKLADFGLAKQFGTGRDSGGRFVTQVGMVMGTPEYMAPEQVAGDPPTPAIDIYALGVILYELLTARVPFQGATPTETMALTQRQEPVSPRRLQPGLPRDLETICLKCLEKSPAKRYESAEALAGDLARWADGKPIKARPVGPFGHASRWASRNPAVAALSAAVVFVALAGLSGIAWNWRDAVAHANAARKAEKEAVDHANAERWERYRSNIAVAASALQLHSTQTARMALDGAPAEHRSWEWQHYNSQLDGSMSTLAVQSIGSRSFPVCALTPDGTRLVTATRTGDVEWRDGKTLETLAVCHAHKGAVEHLVMNASGTRILTGSAEMVRVWDAKQAAEIAVLPLNAKNGMRLAVSPSGTTFAVGSDIQAVRICDTDTAKVIAIVPFHMANVRGLLYTPDGKRIVTAYPDRTIRVWDAATGAAVSVLDGQPEAVASLALSSDGTLLAVASGVPDNEIRVWDLKTKKCLHTLPGHRNLIWRIAFSPDGSRLASSSQDQTIRLWDLKYGVPIAKLSGHTGAVETVEFSPDGTRLVSASYDETVRLWDGVTGDPLVVLRGHTREVKAAAFVQKGSRIVSMSADGTVRLWDAQLAEANVLRGHTSYLYDVAVSPNGKYIASCGWDGTARLWDAATRQLITVFRHQATIVTGAAFSADSRKLLTVARHVRQIRDGRQELTVWDVERRTKLCCENISAEGIDIRATFDATGERVVVAALDKTIRWYDAATLTELTALRRDADYVHDLAMRPGGRHLATGDDSGKIRLWDAASGDKVADFAAHDGGVTRIAYSHDGKILATASKDKTVRLWDADTHELLGIMPHGSAVYTVAFHPEGQRLATGCADNTIRLWDVKSRQEVAVLRGHDDYVHAVAFTPDGTRLVSVSGDATVRIWDTVRPQDRAAKKK